MFSYTLVVFMAPYTGWFTFHSLNACGQVKRLNPGQQFTFAYTVLMVVLVMICMGIGAMYPLPSAPEEFLLFYGMTNTYVWGLSFAYAPNDSQATRLVEESCDRENLGLSEQGGVNDNEL